MLSSLTKFCSLLRAFLAYTFRNNSRKRKKKSIPWHKLFNHFNVIIQHTHYATDFTGLRIRWFNPIFYFRFEVLRAQQKFVTSQMIGIQGFLFDTLLWGYKYLVKGCWFTHVKNIHLLIQSSMLWLSVSIQGTLLGSK